MYQITHVLPGNIYLLEGQIFQICGLVQITKIHIKISTSPAAYYHLSVLITNESWLVKDDNFKSSIKSPLTEIISIEMITVVQV